MNKIKKLKINGLKKFKHIEIDLDRNMNIIVGENESGKSTILEAINIVLNQQYKNSDKYIIKDLINIENIKNFERNPSIENLPKINIELELNIKPEEKNSEMLYGKNNSEGKEKYGISFCCEFDEEFQSELLETINSGKIPYEYYNMEWKTFQGSSYNNMRKYLKSIFIDTSNSDANNSFNYYNKNLFNSKFSDNEKMRIKNDFRNKINSVIRDIKIQELEENKIFGINNKKVIFENIISIFDGDIPLENKGKGLENIIKTDIALNKSNGLNEIDIVLIEEPENHLSSSNLLKILCNIEEKMLNSQMIITTHNNLIASRLKLNNILWISDNKSNSLNNIDEKTADFFAKSTNNNFLQLLLSGKIILVEGPTEYLLIPEFYKKITNKTLEEDKITIISCNGISYKRYLEIADKTCKKVAVITDNDKKQNNIDFKNEYNAKTVNQKIFMDDKIDNWTWEVCLYNINKELLDEIIKCEKNADYKFNGQDYGQKLGKMLNNKTDTAYIILNKILCGEFNLKIPEYLKKAIEWIKN